ncbi:MAG: 2-succinyl-6-hydroxy-2,4-cyclohexadiene-1-carboxylate synthase [Balneolaceae bacterium]|jgi:2-succinyl-6-hydroxy-2,4-cyclohexadiene-1-carboxylate synthase
MKYIKINKETYAYKVHQYEENLPWLLMLHGFMGDHRVFDHLIEDLASVCNPITVDLLGFGQSSTPLAPERYEEKRQIRDMLSLINKLKLKHIFLYGYSMGGRLALKIALDKPGLFKGLILESTNCGIPDEALRKERREKDKMRANQIRSNFKTFLSKWEKLELFHSPKPVSLDLKKRYHQIQSSQKPTALSASLLGFGTGIMTPSCNHVQDFEHPVLLLAGSSDKKYQQINKDLANRFPFATFTSVLSGHRVHLDNPEAFLKEIKNFID